MTAQGGCVSEPGPSTSATSRTRAEEGVYASRLYVYPTYPNKPGNTMATRTYKSTGREARCCIKGPSPAFARIIGRHRGGAEQNGVFIIKKPELYPGSESRARMSVLVQVGLDSACFQAQYTEQPSCGLQARAGPARSGLAFAAPGGRVPSGNGASVPLLLLVVVVSCFPIWEVQPTLQVASLARSTTDRPRD